MRSHAGVVCALAAGSLLSSHARAQILPLNEGDEIRIESRETTGEFRVIGVAGDSLTVRDDPAPDRTITIGDLTWLEVSRGRSSFGAVVGGTLGALGGVVSGAALAWDTGPLVGFAAAAAGMVGGGALGVKLLGPKRWEQILPLDGSRIGSPGCLRDPRAADVYRGRLVEH